MGEAFISRKVEDGMFLHWEVTLKTALAGLERPPFIFWRWNGLLDPGVILKTALVFASNNLRMWCLVSGHSEGCIGSPRTASES